MDNDKLRSLLKELLAELLTDNLEIKIEKARGEIEVKLTNMEIRGIKKAYRQGEILIFKVKSIPKTYNAPKTES